MLIASWSRKEYKRILDNTHSFLDMSDFINRMNLEWIKHYAQKYSLITSVDYVGEHALSCLLSMLKTLTYKISASIFHIIRLIQVENQKYKLMKTELMKINSFGLPPIIFFCGTKIAFLPPCWCSAVLPRLQPGLFRDSVKLLLWT